MKHLIREIASFLGEPEPLEIERKFLIKYPDIKALENNQNCRKVEIIQTYLNSDESEEIRPHRTSIGDVTQAEKELILQEETLAGKIAAAELILQQREEAKKAVEKAEAPVKETEMEEEKEPVFMEPVFMERPEEENEEE